MWEHLGGSPRPREGIEEKLERDVASTEAGETWVLVIAPEEEPGADAGTVSIWSHQWGGRAINEIGWSVLPEFQSRGLATRAVRRVLERARAEGRWDALHAFPPVTNIASNAICRRAGFSMVGEIDYEYRGSSLRCNHWVLDLAGSGTA